MQNAFRVFKSAERAHGFKIIRTGRTGTTENVKLAGKVREGVHGQNAIINKHGKTPPRRSLTPAEIVRHGFKGAVFACTVSDVFRYRFRVCFPGRT